MGFPIELIKIRSEIRGNAIPIVGFDRFPVPELIAKSAVNPAIRLIAYDGFC